VPRSTWMCESGQVIETRFSAGVRGKPGPEDFSNPCQVGFLQESQDTHNFFPQILVVKDVGDEMDASIHRTGVAMRHTGIGRP